MTTSEHARPPAVTVLGVTIDNYTKAEAIDLLTEQMEKPTGRTNTVFIVNAHTLNLAHEDADYRSLLSTGFRVFGDGTGVRWAARARGVAMRDNLVGTDLVPELMQATAGRGYRYFLLGGDPDTIAGAARAAVERFPGWQLAGFHEGYFDADEERVIDSINQLAPELLLVGMGNPVQERFLAQHQHRLAVPVCIGVGGLFHHWSGGLTRAPLWVRKLGFEWLQLLLQQPHKAGRYLIGNPKFLWRMLRTWPADTRTAIAPERADA